MTQNKWQSIGLEILVVGCLMLAVYYFVTPADKLAHFIPGYEMGSHSAHFKHGLAALVLAAALGSLLWFTTGKKPTETAE